MIRERNRGKENLRIGILAAFLVLCLLPAAADARETGIAEVRIVSAWGGLGTPRRSEMIIRRTERGYVADAHEVSSSLINELAAAVREPALPSPSLRALGITEQWLQANGAAAARERYKDYFDSAAPNQRDLFLKSYSDPVLAEKLVRDLYQSRWTDDVPYLEVSITSNGGGTTVVKSTAQPEYMLPLAVTLGGRTRMTYNARLARAIAALVPEEFTNRTRLSGERLRLELAERVMREIESDWKRLEVANKAGEALQAIQARFKVSSIAIDPYNSVDFGVIPEAGVAEQMNLEATLKRPDFPGALQVGLVLPFVHGRVEGTDEFLGSVDTYLGRALAVPWIRALARRPGVDLVEIRYVNDRSLSEKATRIFRTDMRVLGKETLADEVATVQKDATLVALVEKGYVAYLIVLPDGRVILWRYQGTEAPLGWRIPKDASAECSEYQGRCIGVFVSADGQGLDLR